MIYVVYSVFILYYIYQLQKMFNRLENWLDWDAIRILHNILEWKFVLFVVSPFMYQ